MQEIDVSMLYELQKVLDQEEECKTTLKQLKRNVEELKKKLAITEKDYLDAKNRQQKIKVMMDDENMRLSSLETDKKKYETELYSPKNANPKLLKDLEKKIVEIKHNIDQSEEKVLRLMDLMDQAKCETEKKDGLAQEIRQVFGQQQEALDSISHQTNEKMTALSKQKQDIQSQLPENFQQAFQKAWLLQNKAVAVVVDGLEPSCSICKFEVPKRVVESGKKNRCELYYCENCGRILYFLQ
jgi:predicted  nucleic acid-binding Zn-ribbon protein